MARQHKVNKTGPLIRCFGSFQNARKHESALPPKADIAERRRHFR